MSELQLIHAWCLLVASLCAVCCALLGNYLVLRKLSLLGDAVSHAILPGLALAFLLTGSRAPIPMFIGASICGLLTAFVSQFLSKYCRVDEGAALGVVFTTLFALGVLLIRFAADKVDLDPGCVLYGMLEFAPFDTVHVFGMSVPRSITVLAPMLLLIVLFISAFYKELKLTSFDPAFADTIGVPTLRLHFLLMALVAATSVAAFESVGSILVIAMFIIPPATARLCTDSFSWTLALSILIGLASAFLGYDGAVRWNTSVAGSIATAAGGIFFAALFLAPRYGIFMRLMQRFWLQLRVVSEDILGLAYRCEEQGYNRKFPLSTRNIAAAIGNGPLPHLALLALSVRRELVRNENRCYQLSESGKVRARTLIRSHRLWETYLVEHLHLDKTHVHGTATTLEHFTNEEMLDALEQRIGDKSTDPHGREIPTPKDS